MAQNKPYFTSEAQRLAFLAWQKLKLEIPVDLHLVASRLGVKIEERKFVDEIDGVYLRLPGTAPIICINTQYTKPPTRQRFTLAHEIGHHVLVANKCSGKIIILDSSKNNSRSMMERACDNFAAMLLMPEDIIKENYAQLSRNPQNRVLIMAERFGVSVMAMRRRLRELGFVEKYKKFYDESL